MLHRSDGETDHLTIYPEALLEVLQSPDSAVSMNLTVYPQEMLTLIAWPEHMAPTFSSICVTHGPVSEVTAISIQEYDIID